MNGLLNIIALNTPKGTAIPQHINHAIVEQAGRKYYVTPTGLVPLKPAG